MKKVAALCLAVMLLSLTVVSALALGENMTMFVNTQDHKPLKLRSGEGQNYSVLLKIDFGQPVQVVENRGTWSAVTYNGVHGYVMTKFLSYYKPSGTPAPKYTPQPIPVPVPVPTMQPYYPTDMNTIFRSMVKVNPYTAYACPSRPGGFVNLRWAPSKDMEVIAKMYYGAQVTVIAEGFGWSQVMDPTTGYVGFMMTEFLMR